jgi:hypothetical protein
MPGRIHPAYWPIEHIAITIEALWIGRPPRTARLLLIVLRKSEPEVLLMFFAQRTHKPRRVEVNGQSFERHALHAAAGIARNNRIRAGKAPEYRVVIAGMVVQ